MTQKPRFDMVAGLDGKFHFHLKTAQGETVLTGGGFATQYAAIQAIASVMRYGAYDSRYARRATADGQYSFQLLAPSGRILGWSAQYLSKQGCENGIVAVRRAVQFGRVLDLN